jgi:hypothetical protein
LSVSSALFRTVDPNPVHFHVTLAHNRSGLICQPVSHGRAAAEDERRLPSDFARPVHLLRICVVGRLHVPSDAELERLFSDVPEAPAEPVERGDLPDDGDGAPIDPVGPGG